jgi:two-component system, NarL family, response regulator NreC
VTAKRIRVLVADDHETVRQGLRALLAAKEDIDVVAEAPNGRQAIDRAKALKPDIAVLDLSMPGVSGLAAARAIKASQPDVGIVALTRHADDASVQELLAAGAGAYVLKQSPVEEHANAYLSRSATAQSRPPITDREASVLRLMAIGHSNKEIASALDIAIKTVEVHKANAMRKLDLRGRIDVVRYAVLNGCLQDLPDLTPATARRAVPAAGRNPSKRLTTSLSSCRRVVSRPKAEPRRRRRDRRLAQ